MKLHLVDADSSTKLNTVRHDTPQFHLVQLASRDPEVGDKCGDHYFRENIPLIYVDIHEGDESFWTMGMIFSRCCFLYDLPMKLP